MTNSTITADREELFAKLADPATTGKFFERVSKGVSWTVMVSHPLAGSYTSEQLSCQPERGVGSDGVCSAIALSRGRPACGPPSRLRSRNACRCKARVIRPIRVMRGG
jgi:hypothetical protein